MKTTEHLHDELTKGLGRRHFLRASASATLAALTGAAPRTVWAAERPKATADAMILIWMAGGMAQTETFDPKRYTPFEPGLESNRVLSTFRPIPTALDGVELSEGLPKIGSVLDRGVLIRSYRSGDLGFILHSRHQYHWHTGYAPPLSVAAPHLGAWISKLLGPKNPDMPAFIDIGQNLEIGAESDSLKAFHTAGVLGTEFGPFFIADPNDAAASVRPPEGISPQRFRARYASYRKLAEAGPIGREGATWQRESLLASLENGYRLLTSPAAQAFDLSAEPEANVARYGDSRFGRSCLLARRLVEAGARFVEATTEYIPFRYWDTHENGHTRARGMKETIDGPVSQLILDLEERGLLDRTIVVLASEFGRDMMTEGRPGATVQTQAKVPDRMQELKHYGMHRHFTEASSALVFGGGFRRGLAYGKTADERPCSIVEGEIGIEDLHATLYHALGIAPDDGIVIEQRPFYVTKDGKGRVRRELLEG
ncbi:MAG: DUF1501 domain-containing protein [Acidobacteria bacterium]|nr:DUF1501 domain-containing protein [Acidobacteriota bacterium]